MIRMNENQEKKTSVSPWVLASLMAMGSGPYSYGLADGSPVSVGKPESPFWYRSNSPARAKAVRKRNKDRRNRRRSRKRRRK